ncbi:carboxylesterase family protein [Trinickia sp. NRRL B-1857]|uniref:carboxylesterase/lipase family protein n=1 Tax=Trinickia sp. NRRL B-1857 TaxID=3162879 RepID=UPI003D2E1EC7
MNISFDRATQSRFAAALTAAASLSCLVANGTTHAAMARQAPSAQLADGIVEGVKLQGQYKDVRVFRGIPYAAPPVDDLRFREPQSVARWAGVRSAKQFGPRCMQPNVAGKPDFRSTTMSEDCLYLNVWTPASSASTKLPVLVFFHGGGFVSGDGSESRYDGANLASRGIVAVTLNYRLGVFGFLAPAGVAGESSQGTAGNFGWLDQLAALRWVRQNIAQFGGDPSQVTIAGTSAGSVSVSAHMSSPLSRGLFARAIGQSGGAFASQALWTREQSERAAAAFSSRVGATSLRQLRSLPAQTLLAATAQPLRSEQPAMFEPSVDGYFLNESPEQVFARGGQTQVPLLLGSNAQHEPPSTASEPAQSHRIMTLRERLMWFVDQVDVKLAHYPGSDDVAQSTRRWMDLHRQTGQVPVFYYRYTHDMPREIRVDEGTAHPPILGAAHDAQAAYSLGNLGNSHRYAWTAADYDVSRIFSSYLEQFVKTGDPNGAASVPGESPEANAAPRNTGSVPSWPALRVESQEVLRQVIGPDTHSVWDASGPQPQPGTSAIAVAR